MKLTAKRANQRQRVQTIKKRDSSLAFNCARTRQHMPHAIRTRGENVGKWISKSYLFKGKLVKIKL